MLTVVALALCHVVKAVPGAVEDSPEVIPAPGRPSLPFLSLTFADPYKRVPGSHFRYKIVPFFNASLTNAGPEEMKRLEARLNPVCGEIPSAYSEADAVAFLNTLGTQACTVTGENSIFCTAESCKWCGRKICLFLLRRRANAANGNGNPIVSVSAQARGKSTG
ncbi:hypothetical protein DFH09DRAFT_1315610 [Mycena vulgaris]|nr:hypothetical protein DFH09DRAFT_1315610 [Mycena vulgaris]